MNGDKYEGEWVNCLKHGQGTTSSLIKTPILALSGMVNQMALASTFGLTTVSTLVTLKTGLSMAKGSGVKTKNLIATSMKGSISLI